MGYNLSMDISAPVIIYEPFHFFSSLNQNDQKAVWNKLCEEIAREEEMRGQKLVLAYTRQEKYFGEHLPSLAEPIIFIDESLYSTIVNSDTSFTLYYFKEDEAIEKILEEKRKDETIRIKSFSINEKNEIKIEENIPKYSKETGIYRADDHTCIYLEYEKSKEILRKIRLKKPLLVLGPRGSGKTTIIQKCFKEVLQDMKDFVCVACGSLEPSLAKSELFGYVKGAFTGATTNKKGYVEQAKGGCLYLDEVQDLPRDVQRMLIKCVEEHKFYPVGSEKSKDSDFLLICSSNKPLKELRKLIDDDLFDRISTLPPIKLLSLDEQKKRDENFISKCLRGVWENCRTLSPNKLYFLSFNMLKRYNVPGEGSLQEKIISALKNKELHGNYRDIISLINCIDSFAFYTRTNREGSEAYNEDIDLAIKEWEEYIDERNALIAEEMAEEAITEEEIDAFIEEEKWSGINKMFKAWVAARASQKYGSPTAAAGKLGVDKKSIIKSGKEAQEYNFS